MIYVMFLERKVEKEKIKKLIAMIFNITEEFVTFESDKMGTLHYIRYLKKGFRTYIEFYIDASKVSVSNIKSEKDLAILMAKEFNTLVLIDSGEINPYTFILIDIEGKAYNVDQINITDDDIVEVRIPENAIRD